MSRANLLKEAARLAKLALDPGIVHQIVHDIEMVAFPNGGAFVREKSFVKVNPFAFSNIGVTMKLWEEIMKGFPTTWSPEKAMRHMPFRQNELDAFLSRLSEKCKQTFRAPTEDEWTLVALGNPLDEMRYLSEGIATYGLSLETLVNRVASQHSCLFLESGKIYAHPSPKTIRKLFNCQAYFFGYRPDGRHLDTSQPYARQMNNGKGLDIARRPDGVLKARNANIGLSDSDGLDVSSEGLFHMLESPALYRLRLAMPLAQNAV